jgi:hypothetical protein
MMMILVFAAIAGCGQTTGKRVLLHTQVTSDLTPGESFTTGTNWTVTLDEAMVATGALYYYDGEPAFVMAPKRNFFRDALELFSPIQTAYAHPGHYVAGNAK